MGSQSFYATQGKKEADCCTSLVLPSFQALANSGDLAQVIAPTSWALVGFPVHSGRHPGTAH